MAFRHTLWAVLRQRCPRCKEGKVFAAGTRMNPDCPVCQLHFEREAGYFLGAMYVSYGMMSILLMGLMFIGTLIWPNLDLGWMIVLAIVVSLPLVPMIFRYSRVIWITFERWALPSEGK